MMRREGGDTLIEVLLGIAILSVVIVSTVTLMSFGTGQSQTALEHSQVRAELKGQASMLEYLRDQYIATDHSASGPSGVWKTILASYVTNLAAGVPEPSETDTCAKSNHKFYLSQGVVNPLATPAISTAIGIATTYAKPGQGVWVDAYRPGGVTPVYIDFIVKACWNSLSSKVDQQEATIVRLYDGN